MTATDESDGRRINVVQGEYSVSADPSVVFTTILGSCVAACIRDPVAAVGGINHFLLPGDEEGGGQPRRSTTVCTSWSCW
jgi:chemotaxis protein CheD